MRNCNTCEYLTCPYYEENYYECSIFGEEVPEEYETEDGCNCTDEELKKFAEQNEQAWIEFATDFTKWLEENEDFDGRSINR